MKVYHKLLTTFIILAAFLSFTLLGPTHAQDKCGVRPHCPPPCDGTCSCHCCGCETSYPSTTCDRYTTRCECQTVQGPRYADLDTNMSVYKVGEKVEIIFRNPEDHDFKFSKVYVQQLAYNQWETPRVVTVFERENPQSVEPGTRWTWIWNQKDCTENQVAKGRFMAVIVTEKCESYRALFRIGQLCSPSGPTLCSCYSDICDP